MRGEGRHGEGVGGGNLLLLASDTDAALAAAERAVAAMRTVPNVIMPFPGGVVRSGSKVGSKYTALPASTNDAFCPTLRRPDRHRGCSPETRSVLEIVIDGLTRDRRRRGDARGHRRPPARIGRGARRAAASSAGNYGGKLGPHHFHLKEVLA